MIKHGLVYLDSQTLKKKLNVEEEVLIVGANYDYLNNQVEIAFITTNDNVDKYEVNSYPRRVKLEI